jgi:phosphoribosylaminoimidazole (AIR) synthetase
MSQSISYADAGVSIDNANRAVAKIREYARSTFNERTLTEIGSFGGMFSGAFPQMANPILVASADGVGTKLKLAFETGIHNRSITPSARTLSITASTTFSSRVRGRCSFSITLRPASLSRM